MRNILFPLLASIGTMALLFWIGNTFHFSLFGFSLDLNEPLENGMFFDANISILPVVIGLFVGFTVERIVKVRNN
ncbi:hypothetical protein CIB95_08670 [Lottiidibacillus patelloidae]|uniref:Uncharacterized protein n=1 Tax=Lottiidibacillus patelloidae TaxID=2670334 RepID=A0A263BT03_9BACI|nr:hypothetical protein [Lottiidibacillus patelloidae]OZM56835.1 hypothetical protein CIB95_08670 [Lottiidibacillus patelloidae]